MPSALTLAASVQRPNWSGKRGVKCDWKHQDGSQIWSGSLLSTSRFSLQDRGMWWTHRNDAVKRSWFWPGCSDPLLESKHNSNTQRFSVLELPLNSPAQIEQPKNEASWQRQWKAKQKWMPKWSLAMLAMARSKGSFNLQLAPSKIASAWGDSYEAALDLGSDTTSKNLLSRQSLTLPFWAMLGTRTPHSVLRTGQAVDKMHTYTEGLCRHGMLLLATIAQIWNMKVHKCVETTSAKAAVFEVVWTTESQKFQKQPGSCFSSLVRKTSNNTLSNAKQYQLRILFPPRL